MKVALPCIRVRTQGLAPAGQAFDRQSPGRPGTGASPKVVCFDKPEANWGAGVELHLAHGYGRRTVTRAKGSMLPPNHVGIERAEGVAWS